MDPLSFIPNAVLAVFMIIFEVSRRLDASGKSQRRELKRLRGWREEMTTWAYAQQSAIHAHNAQWHHSTPAEAVVVKPLPELKAGDDE
ncbi:hypothetical protein ACQCX2_17550 [Propionibacteriaceae bacterium Y1700]|uniref:hypothetical protein n=1 Tax=Microlunatus sp. Y1700 TaxID=3418487 RepID=UPI003DA70642